MKRSLFFAFCLLSGLTALAHETIELTGEWECSVGDSTQYNDFVVLPGSVSTNEKVWLRKNVYVPQTWEKQRITLFLERPLGDFGLSFTWAAQQDRDLCQQRYRGTDGTEGTVEAALYR